MPTTAETTRIKVYVGAGYADWVTYLTSQSLVEADVLDLLIADEGDLRLVAATILESLADPTTHEAIKSENRGSLDTKGQAEAFLAKAKKYREDVQRTASRRRFVGMSAGGSTIPAFIRSDPPLETGESTGTSHTSEVRDESL
jgi:hypothetical protein